MGDRDPYAVRPNAPVAVVMAAKASLKDPTRPVTPADNGRQLFSRDSDFAQNRPPSAYGLPTSKLFYDQQPKLAIPRIDSTIRPDGASTGMAGMHSRRSILEGGTQGESFTSPRPNSHTSGRPPSWSMGRSSSQQQRSAGQELEDRASASSGSSPWQQGGSASQRVLARTPSITLHSAPGSETQGPGHQVLSAAQTVAALKATLAAMEVGGPGRLPGGGVQHGPWLDEEDPGQQLLDPRRNDDLPPRPGTSRGRPASSSGTPGLDGFPMTTQPGRIPLPSNVDMGTGAQVLDMATAPTYSDTESTDEEDDQPYSHLYNYTPGPSSGKASLGGSQPGGLQDGSPGPKGVGQAPGPVLDPSDAFFKWRAAVEATLSMMAAATAALSTALAGGAGSAVPSSGRQDATTLLVRHTGALVGLAEQCRQQAEASKWLNSASSCFADAAGCWLTLREAISEHVFRLMDSSNTELLLKAAAVVLRVVKSRQPLQQTGKLLYRLSKDSGNDSSFRREGVLEPMLRTVHIMVASCASAAAKQAPGAGSQADAASAPPQPAASPQLHEPLVYYLGTMKNISNDAANQKALVKAGALHVLCGAISSMVQQIAPNSSHAADLPAATSSGIPAASSQPPSGAGQPASTSSPPTTSSSSNVGPTQVAVQATGVLRNLAVAPAHAPLFLSCGGLAALKAAAQALPHQQELVLNVGRVLSKLSLDEQCQAAVEADPSYAPLLVSLLKQHLHQRPLLLRLAFVLGNLTTHSDAYRQQVAHVPGALDLLTAGLEQYAAGADALPSTPTTAPAGHAPGGGPAPPQPAGSKADRLAKAASVEDCCIKLLRLVANLAIHPQVGAALSERASLAASLQSLLDAHQYGGGNEELVLNACCMLTNLSFYHQSNNHLLSMEPGLLLRHVTPLLLSDNEEAVVEAARAFGNFSRVAQARQYLVTARVLEALVLLLDHSSAEVLYSVCGTLINFSADAARKGELITLGAPARLVDVLERCVAAAATPASPSVSSALEGPYDMQVGTLCVVCKALFNLCADEASSSSGAGSSVLSPTMLSSLAAVLQTVDASTDLLAQPEVLQVTNRLKTVVQRLSGSGP